MEKAKAALEKYIKFTPDAANPYDSMGEFYLQQKQYDPSIEMYKKALSKDPEFFMSQKGLGVNYFYLGNHEEALVCFQKYLTIAPQNALKYDAIQSMTKTYLDKYDIDNALNVFKKYYALAESDKDYNRMFQAIRLTGDLQITVGKFDEAEKTYLPEKDILPKTTWSKNVKELNRGYYLLNSIKIALSRNNLAKAKELFKEHDNLDIKEPKKLRSYWRIQYEIAMYEKRYDDALKILEEESLTYPQAWHRAALTYEGKGDIEKARQYWRKIVDFNYFDNLLAPLLRHEAKKHL
jgi:tetratricopeptide (TPR) repeat protein